LLRQKGEKTPTSEKIVSKKNVLENEENEYQPGQRREKGVREGLRKRGGASTTEKEGGEDRLISPMKESFFSGGGKKRGGKRPCA